MATWLSVAAFGALPSGARSAANVWGEQFEAPRQVSRTKMLPEAPWGTRFVAVEKKATKRPSELTAGVELPPFDTAPAALTDTTSGNGVLAAMLAFRWTEPPVPTLNGTETETPPPGAGFETVTLIVAFE